jgi:hypothetical protein
MLGLNLKNYDERRYIVTTNSKNHRDAIYVLKMWGYSLFVSILWTNNF